MARKPKAKAQPKTTSKTKPAAKNRGLRPHARSFVASLQEFLTPAIWKQAEAARCQKRSSPRWSTHPLVLTLLLMTWCCGDSQAERFESAKGVTAVCLTKRRRPGQTVQGFQKTLALLPMNVLRIVAAGIRRILSEKLDLMAEGFVAFGCDGSSMGCPRTAELESRLDPARKKSDGTPQVWVTALVHLRTGLLWAWRLGKGYNREREHLQAMLSTLPNAALIVADPGFNGYTLAQALTTAGVSYLIRMSGKDTLYTTAEVPIDPDKYESGEVLLWPTEARKEGLPPQRMRLICIRRRDRRNVWLLTNVMDSKRLTVEMAGRYYRWRWESESVFRTFKRTLAKVKLTSRTVRLIHREAEGALLATQLLLAQGTCWKAVKGSKRSEESEGELSPRCSPRKILLSIRAVITGKIGARDAKSFSKRMAGATRENRVRTSSKVKRPWPGRTSKKLKPPKILTLTRSEKALAAKLLRSSA